MTFRNTASLIFIFFLLLSCKGVQYYKSGTNPAGVSVVLHGPSQFYTNIDSIGQVMVGVVNHNSQSITLPSWWNDFSMIGQSRFYEKELVMKYNFPDVLKSPLTIQPGDTLLLFSVPIQDFLNDQKGWMYKTKPSMGPHLITSKKTFPYIYLTAELKTNVVNQDPIKIRSNPIKITIGKWVESKQVNKKTELSISSDIQTFNTHTREGNLICKITNTGDYPIPLFNDPGAVRFRIFAYNPNRTSVMHTEYILDNGKLPVEPVSIASKSSYTVTIPINQLLFTERPEGAKLYWIWNKKHPPVSPLVYGKKDIALTTEFWFGVIVDGKEYLSNTISLPIDSPNKKTRKSK